MSYLYGEEDVIEVGERLLEEHVKDNHPMVGHYSELLNEYKKLHNQNKKLIKIGDILNNRLMKKNINLKEVVEEEKALNKRIKKLYEKVKQLSMMDSLTQIYNRRAIIKKMRQKMKKVTRINHTLCCLIMDLDHFKGVNDQYGHPAGDYVLQEFCRVVEKNIRDTDLLGRLGGEEFILVIDEEKSGIGLQVAERVRRSIEEHNFLFKGEKIPLTASIGVSDFNEKMDIEEMIKRADGMLYLAKKSGRNCVRVWSDYNKNGL